MNAAIGELDTLTFELQTTNITRGELKVKTYEGWIRRLNEAKSALKAELLSYAEKVKELEAELASVRETKSAAKSVLKK
jgi:hypothetical protein